MEAGQVQVGVRAAVHALDAALAEHRRSLALAASRREQERMARGREVKTAAQASEQALEQPVERPMRGVRLAEAWIEVDRVQHPLTAAVYAEVVESELRVRGEGWTGRLALAPGEGPAAAAHAAAARIEEAAAGSVITARERLALVVATAREHALACHAAASALAAADREAAERHSERARLDGCVTELAARLGPRRPDEPPEAASARDRLAHARAHLASPPAQPYAWIEGWPPEVAGAMLRDLDDDELVRARPAMDRLAPALDESEPLLALAVAGHEAGPVATRGNAVVIALTPSRLFVAAEAVRSHRPTEVELPSELMERQPGRLAAALEIIRAARL
jgi:hypothetical protein